MNQQQQKKQKHHLFLHYFPQQPFSPFLFFDFRKSSTIISTITAARIVSNNQRKYHRYHNKQSQDHFIHIYVSIYISISTHSIVAPSPFNSNRVHYQRPVVYVKWIHQPKPLAIHSFILLSFTPIIILSPIYPSFNILLYYSLF